MVADAGEVAEQGVDPHDDPSMPRRALLRNIVVLAVALPAAAFALIMVGELVPDRLVAESLFDAAQAGQLDTNSYPPGLIASQVDGFTDCIGLTIGLGDLPGRNIVSSAIAGQTLWQCEDAVPALEAWATGDGALERQTDYFRYWHGYSAFLRPSIAFLGLPATRVLVMAALGLALFGLARSVARVHGRAVATVLLAPFVLTSDFVDLPYALPHAFGVLGGLTTAWVANAVAARNVRPWPVIAVSATSGAAVVVFDLLNSAPGLWSLCSFVVAAAAARRQVGWTLFGTTALAAGSWIVGYAWTWGVKWLISIPVFGFERVRDTVDYTVNNRLTTETGELDLTFGETIRRNVVFWRDQPMTGWVVVATVVVVAVVWWRRRRRPGLVVRGLDRSIVAATVVIVLVWYEVLRNHSQTHTFFTYRALPLAFGILAAAAVLPMRRIRSDVADSGGPPALATEFGADHVEGA
ncbi:MAG: hypothetical protein AAGF73_03505 [Actinomycetota bacterium]